MEGLVVVGAFVVGVPVVRGPSADLILISAQFTKVSCSLPSPLSLPVVIATPEVAHGPPPLHHAVITCQAFRKHELNLEQSISRRV